jgi:NAD(P)-dependent dehydrogenase (short-subunit alcohol dehydrogenase family)
MGADGGREHQIIYSATKHAVWAMAEGLRDAMAEASPQVAVSMVCPGAVATPMTEFAPGYMEAAEAARRVFAAIDADRYLIFTHPDFQAAFEKRMAALAADAWGS